jgi:hypothetical protein
VNDVWCANPDHSRRVRAAFRVTYPTGRFLPTTACASCARWLILDQADEAETIVLNAVPHRRVTAAHVVAGFCSFAGEGL